jgi:hypothetical protein
MFGSCGPSLRPEAHFANERSFLRLGVELDKEDDAVRHVLAQRRLSVTSEVRGPIFIALGAATFDERLTAVRLITPRGVIAAEDAAQDDLFAPASLRLLDHLPATFGDYFLAAWTRIAHARDLGCVTLLRVLPDGSGVAAVLDVSDFGPRACVADLGLSGEGRLRALLAFPGLHAEQTPHLYVELSFQTVPLGQQPPRVPVAKIASGGTWLEAERARVEALERPNATFEERHSLGVARAAVALLSGLSQDAQVAAYRSSVGRVMPGSQAAVSVAEALDYIERGWSETASREASGKTAESLESGDVVIAPEPMSDAGTPSEPLQPEDDAPAGGLIIEPQRKP